MTSGDSPFRRKPAHREQATGETPSLKFIRNSELLNGKGDINQHGFLVNQKKAEPLEIWVKIDCVVTEKMNLSTGDFLRYASIAS